MKSSLLSFAVFAALAPVLTAQNAETPAPPLQSTVYDWTKLAVVPIPNGERRFVFDGPTTTLDRVHCHITTLAPGQVSGEPTLHLQEEILIVKEGTVEVTVDGRIETAGPGSVIFFAAHATTRLRNATDRPATYHVIYYYTPKTPKE
jgi:mannose-6-phosphate isomerase-like protein (cupin superfamily)